MWKADARAVGAASSWGTYPSSALKKIHRNCSNNSFHSHHQRDQKRKKEPDQAQPKTVEEWIEVTRKKKKKSPQKAEDKSATASSTKATTPTSTKATPPAAIYIPKSVTAPIPAHITDHPPASKTRKKSKSKPAPTTPEAEETPMETTTNLKRRRSSGEGAAKKVCSGPPCPEDPLEGPSNAFSPKPLPQQAPPHLPFPPPLLSLPPPILHTYIQTLHQRDPGGKPKQPTRT